MQLLSHKNSEHHLHRCLGCTPKQVTIMVLQTQFIQAEAGDELAICFGTFLHKLGVRAVSGRPTHAIMLDLVSKQCSSVLPCFKSLDLFLFL
jgi:hypothetical protein